MHQCFSKHPTLLVVDVGYEFTSDRPEPILESIKHRGNSRGKEAWEGIKAIQPVLAAARDERMPVAVTIGRSYSEIFEALSMCSLRQ